MEFQLTPFDPVEKRRADSRRWDLKRRTDPVQRKKLLDKKRRERQRRADKIREYNKAYSAKNKEADRAWKLAWEKRNPGIVSLGRVRRKAAEKQAVPKWVDTGALNAIYAMCARASACTGGSFHVDHIIPLRGKTVCGLHVPWNLQVIPAINNLRKSNRLDF